MQKVSVMWEDAVMVSQATDPALARAYLEENSG